MNKNKLVKKDNALVESRCDLTLNQQKLVLAVVSMINRNDEDFKEYFISVKEFMGLMNLKGESLYSELRRSAKELKSKVLIIPREGKKELFTSWFSDIEMDYEGRVGFSFSKKLKPYLLQLKQQFTAYQLKNILMLKSKYSVRIYELLKQYQNIECRRFDLMEFRELLFIEPEKYQKFGNFKARILVPSVKDINTHTDIHIDYTLHKTGRTVTAVEFCIEKQSSDPSAPQKKSPPLAIINLIPEEHRKPCRDICQRIFDQDGTDGLKFYIEKANGRKKAKNSSYGGYLKSIFNLDVYGDMREALEAQAKAEAESKRLKKEVLEAQRRQQVKRESEQAKLKRQNDMLADIETNDPDRWIKLKKQAAGNLGMKNPKRPGPGGKTKIRFEITRILEHD